ncbi:hypothetical protein PF002_g4318 [Phytophthora fragariae]|uniref:Uncharacterized protein n=1 Tax=Phytophthora fragariae TaxID=53985 RepID=A0A6A4A7D2_9STRA|nr:hypothetical protein PF002_g4318 [Phytophthora fragariae]
MPGWAQRGAAAEFNLVEVANEHVLVAMGDSVVVTDLVSDSPARARRRTGSHWVNAVAGSSCLVARLVPSSAEHRAGGFDVLTLNLTQSEALDLIAVLVQYKEKYVWMELWWPAPCTHPSDR